MSAREQGRHSVSHLCVAAFCELDSERRFAKRWFRFKCGKNPILHIWKRPVGRLLNQPFELFAHLLWPFFVEDLAPINNHIPQHRKKRLARIQTFLENNACSHRTCPTKHVSRKSNRKCRPPQYFIK